MTIVFLVVGFSFSQQYGNISGLVTDQEGRALPGANVTLEGEFAPKLVVTSESGIFRFLNLSPGKYIVKCELPGFNTHIQENIIIQVGVNVNLKVKMTPATTVKEVRIVEQSPVVDSKETGTTTNVQDIALKEIPTARDPWVVMQAAPRISGSRENVGGSRSGQQIGAIARSNVGGSGMYFLDGIEITDQSSGGGSSPMYFDFDTFEEMQVVTSGQDASVQTGGVAINMVTRRASNKFKAVGRIFWTGEELQGNNLTDELIDAGLKGDRIKQIMEYGIQGGGPIFKNKLWAWFGAGMQDIRRLAINDTPDTCKIPGFNLKLNWQPNQKNVFEFVIILTRKLNPGRGASATRPYETTLDMKAKNLPIKLEYQHNFSDNFMINTKVHAFPRCWGQVAFGGKDVQPSTDLVTDQNWGSWDYFDRNMPAYSVSSDANYFVEKALGGSHEFDFGVEYRLAASENKADMAGGARKYYWNGVPYSAQMYREASGDRQVGRYSAYIKDTFAIDRLTIDIGARYDIEKAMNNATEIKAASLIPDFLPSISVGAIDPGFKWTHFSPRLGLTYDIAGDGKMIIRGSLARYANHLGASLATDVSPTASSWASYYWNDKNGDDIARIDELVGYPLNGLIAYSGFDPYNLGTVMTSPNKIDPNLKPPLTYEAIVGIEREFFTDFSMAANFVIRRNTRLFWRPTNGLSRADYVGPITGTINYEGNTYPYEYWYLNERPAAGTFLTQQTDYYENYMGIEVVAVKRFSKKWMVNASFTYQKSSRNYGEVSFHDPTNIKMLDGTPTSAYQPTWMGKVTGLYRLPFGIGLSASFSSREGYIFAPAIRVKTPERASVGLGASMNLYTEKYGTSRLENFYNLDLRLQKDIVTAKYGTYSLAIDVFNALNFSWDLKRNATQNSPDANQIQNILNPRVIRFSLRFTY